MINQNQKNFKAANNQMIQVCLVISQAKGINRIFNKIKMIQYHRIGGRFHNIYFINKREGSRMIRLGFLGISYPLEHHKI